MGPRVRASLDRVREEVNAHLDYEEEALVELLRGLDAGTPQHAEELVHEHDLERTMIEAVIEDFDAGDRTFQEMTDEIAWLAAAIEQDMENEEREHLDNTVLSDASLVSTKDR